MSQKRGSWTKDPYKLYRLLDLESSYLFQDVRPIFKALFPLSCPQAAYSIPGSCLKDFMREEVVLLFKALIFNSAD